MQINQIGDKPRTVMAAEEFDGVDEARVQRGRPPHAGSPRRSLRRREPAQDPSTAAAAAASSAGAPRVRVAVARRRHGRVVRDDVRAGPVPGPVQRHAPDGPQQAAVGVVQPTAVAHAGRHGHRQMRHGERQLQRRRRRHGRVVGARRPEEASLVVVIMAGCGGREADLEGQIRLGREELHG